MVILTAATAVKPVPNEFHFLRSILPGYSQSLRGYLVGIIYGSVLGTVSGSSLSWLYNRISEGFLPKLPQLPTRGPSDLAERPKSSHEDLKKAGRLWGERTKGKQDPSQPVVS